jgi:polyhydroxyalkanoate synthesis regulator phasin
MMQRTLLAGIGAAALAREVPEDFVCELVQRGRISRDIGQMLIRKLARQESPDIHLAMSLAFVPVDSLRHAAKK